MHTNVKIKVDELNKLYHRIITKKSVDYDETMFKNSVKQLKSWGYNFRLVTPDFDPTFCAFTDDELKLFSRLEIARRESKYGKENQIEVYARMMNNCEKYILRELYVCLCKRGVMPKDYFQMENTSNWIDFIQSDHRIDAYVVF